MDEALWWGRSCGEATFKTEASGGGASGASDATFESLLDVATFPLEVDNRAVAALGRV